MRIEMNAAVRAMQRAYALGAEVSQPLEGKFWCGDRCGSQANFKSLEKLEVWLETAELIQDCRLTWDHHDAAEACGWYIHDSTHNRRGIGRRYSMKSVDGRESFTTASFDLLESKLARLKAEGADLL